MLLGFREAASVVGRTAMTALSWSVATLLIGILISAHKANWLPRRLFSKWGNGSSPTLIPAGDSPPGADGPTMMSRPGHDPDV
jgi:hypothetical protein